MEILEILKGRVSADLDGVTVRWTMVEQWVQPLKRRATLLCDYSRVEHLTRETMEMLEVSKVMKWVKGLVSFGTVVAAEGAVEAFLVNFWPNLVSRIICLPFFVEGCWVISFVFTAYAFVQLPFPSPLS